MWSRKTLIIIFFIALVLIALFVIWYFATNKPKCDPYHEGYDKKGNFNEKCVVKKPTTAPPSESPNSDWTSESFPLNVGMYGVKTKVMQQALIDKYGSSILPKYGADGEFGSETKGALISKGYSVPLPESDYEKIVIKEPAGGDNGGTSGGTNTGKKVYTSAFNDSPTGIYDNQNDFTPYRLAGAGEYVGTYLGTVKDYIGRIYIKLQYTPSTIKYIKQKYASFNP